MHRLLLLTLLGLSTPAFGEGIDRLLDLSLEELLKIKVVTASKKEEAIQDAPGVMTVVTSQEIRAFGARNLKDVLLRIPNFFIFDSYSYSATGNTFRAGATQHVNNHVLYLINGRPLRESQNGGRQTDLNLLFPLNAIERIEVVRGPGSALYGSNAFSGTINIITKESSDEATAKVAVSGGSHRYGSLTASLQVKGERGAYVNAYANLLDEGGATVSAYDSLSQQGELAFSRDGYFSRLEAGYSGFSVEAMKSELKVPNMSGPFSWENLDDWTHSRSYLNLGYLHEFNPDWDLSLNYTLNQMDMAIKLPTALVYQSDGYLFELTARGRLSDASELVVGAVQDHIKGDLAIRGGNYHTVRNSLYAQFDHRLAEKTKVTLGAQWNKPEEQPSAFSPRVALVHQFNENWAAKALYAEAFRSAFGTEMWFESSFLQGDPDLKPETVKTTELQLTYTAPSWTLATTLYHSKTDNLILRQRIDTTTYYINLNESIGHNGIELEGRWQVTPNLQFQGNASYQQTDGSAEYGELVIGSDQMVKMGLAYQTDSGVTASLWHNYLGAVNKLEAISGSSVAVVNPAATSIHLLSFNLSANLGQLTQLSALKSSQLSVYANNLLDEQIWFPEMAQKSVNTYPQSYAQGLYLKLSAWW